MLTATALPLLSAHLSLSLQDATKRCVCVGCMMIKQSKDSKIFCNSLNFNENFNELGIRCTKPCSLGKRLTAADFIFLEVVWGLYLSLNQCMIILVCSLYCGFLP